MARTLLVGHHRASWREWLKSNLGSADLLILDPAEPDNKPPGRLTLHRNGKVVAWSFYGSLDPMRAPHTLLASVHELLERAGDHVFVQAFDYRPNPLLRQTLLALARAVKPNQVLAAEGLDLNLNGFPVGPETVELEEAFPKTVRDAQHKAHFITLLGQCEDHVVDLKRVPVEGARFGSGKRLSPKQTDSLGIPGALYAETCGPVLLVVAADEAPEELVSRALDLSGCTKAQFVHPQDYQGLLCSFARDSGEDFGLGVVQEFDFDSLTAKVKCNAVAPAPVRILKLGGMRISTGGSFLGEIKPWQV